MLYREAGQFKSTYAQDQQIFPIRQDRIAIVLLLVAGAIYFLSQQRVTRYYAVEPEKIPVPTDAAAIERGAHVAKIRGCRECHADDLGGAAQRYGMDIWHEGPSRPCRLLSARGLPGTRSSFLRSTRTKALRAGRGRGCAPCRCGSR